MCKGLLNTLFLFFYFFLLLFLPVSGFSNNPEYPFSFTISTVSGTIANAGSDTAICTTSYTLKANSPGFNEKGYWNAFNAGLTFSDSTNPSAVITGFAEDQTYTLIWTISDTVALTSNSDTITLLYQTTTLADAGIDQCISTTDEKTTVDLLANTYNSSYETGFWTKKDDNTFLSYSNTPSLLLPHGKHVFYWNIQSNAGGCRSTDSVTITIISKPLAGSAQCLVEPISFINLQGNAVNPGETGIWKTSNPAFSFDHTDPKAVISNPSLGNHSFTWIIENAGCKDSSTVQVALISKAETDINQCLTYDVGLSANLSATPVNTLSQKAAWTVAGNTGVVVTPSDAPNAIAQFLPLGITKLYWTVSDSVNPSCFSKDSVLISSVSKPIATAPSCNPLLSDSLRTVTLSGSAFSSAIETGTWTTSDSSISITNASAPSAQVSLIPGTYTFFWSIENTQSGCRKIDSTKLTVSSKAVIKTLPNPLCVVGTGQTIQLEADTVYSSKGEIGFWSDITTTGTPVSITTANSNSTSISGLTEGVHILKWQVNNMGCSNEASIKVSVISKPTVSAFMCLPFGGTKAEFTLSAAPLKTNAETGVWTSNAPLANYRIDFPAQNTTAAKVLKKGNYYFMWTISDTMGICKITDTTKVAALTPPNAGYDQCNTIPSIDTVKSISLAGNLPDSTLETGFWTDAKPVPTIITTTNIASIQQSKGVHTLLWNIQSNKFKECTLSDTLKTRIITKAEVEMPLICQSTKEASIPLLAQKLDLASGESGHWINLTYADSATIVEPTSYQTIMINAKSGSRKLKWVVENDGCQDAAIALVGIRTEPKIDSSICTFYTGNKITTTLHANTSGMGDKAFWEPSIASVDKVNLYPAGNICQVVAWDKNANLIYYKITDTANYCPFIKDSAYVTILTKSILNPAYCEVIPFGATSKTVKLSGNTNSPNETGTWASTSPSVHFSNINTYLTNIDTIGNGKYKIYWNIKNDLDSSCQSIDSTLVRVISKSNAGNNICIPPPVNNTFLKANEPVSEKGEKGIWKTPSNIYGNVINPPQEISNPTSLVTQLPIGVIPFKWIIYMDAQDKCADSSTVLVSVQTKAETSKKDSVCGTNFILYGTPFDSLAEEGHWGKLAPKPILSAADSSETSVSNLVPGSNIFTWTIANAICSNTDTLTIINNQPETVQIYGSDTVNTCFTANKLRGTDPALEIATAHSLWKVLQEPSSNNTYLLNPASEASEAKNMIKPGYYLFTYMIYNSVCDTISDTVLYNRNEYLAIYANGPAEACITDTASITAMPPPPDGIGKWTKTQGGGTFTADSSITGIYDLSEGINSFLWQLERGECSNFAPLEIKGYAPPSTAKLISSDTAICATDTFSLHAVTPTKGTGKWTLISGVGTIVAPEKNKTLVVDVGLGKNVFRWTNTNGPCDSNYSEVTLIRDQKETTADVGVADTSYCGNQIQLFALPIFVGNGTWKVLKGGANIIDTTSPNSEATQLSYSEDNVLVWKVENGTCKSADTLTISTYEPVDKSFAGNDIVFCETDTIQLKGNFPTKGTGKWISLNHVPIKDSSSPVTTATSIPYDTSIFVWYISNVSCKSSDTLQVIRYQNPEQANAGTNTEVFSTSFHLNASPAKNGFWTSLDPQVILNNPEDAYAEVYNAPFGETSFIWTTSNGNCALSHDTVTINRSAFNIPNAFSPNGDGKNNTFEIRGIKQYAPVELTILDRWGSEIYFNKDYQNDWDGKNKNEKELVEDTYYYILKLNNGKIFKGFLILKR